MPRADRVPFLPAWRLVAVRAVINDLTVVLIADTGAEPTIISGSVAKRLSLDLNRPLRTQQLRGVGQSPPVPVVRLDRLRVGSRVATGLEAFVYDLPAAIGADGLLGLNFLRRFRVTFEFDSRMLVLRQFP